MAIEDWTIIRKLAGSILSNTAGNCIVEIGRGHSTSLFRSYSMIFGIPLFSCDINYKKEVNEPLFKTIAKSSVDFMKSFNGIPSLVLLDGCHDYDVVIEEANFFIKKLVVHGVLFIHDTYPCLPGYLVHESCSDCYRVRIELEKRTDIYCFTWPYTANNQGLTMILKKDFNRPFYRE